LVRFTLPAKSAPRTLLLMRIVDRYLLRQFVRAFLICFVSFTGLYIVCELLTNLDVFLAGGRKEGAVFSCIYHYYRLRPLLVFDQTSSVLALIAATFTVSWIQRHNELTALMAAGVSRIRVLRPVIIAGVAVSVLATVNRELLIPRYRTELARRPQDPLGDHPEAVKGRFDSKTGVYLDGKRSFADKMRIESPDFELPLDLRDYGRRLAAASAYYRPAGGGHPNGYLLDGVSEPKNLDSRPSLRLGGDPVLITPRDAPDWLEADQCFLVSDVDFDRLTPWSGSGQLASTAELIRGLRNPSVDYGADTRVEIHSRIVKPLWDLTLLFLGLPLVVARESRNLFLAMGLSMGVTALFVVSVWVSQYLGSLWVRPAPFVWLPLMVFVPVAVWLSESLWK
jgi:lipopolysaccharide export system permease protein